MAGAPVDQMDKKQNTNRISELRLNRHWSQGELAEACGAHWVTISKLERGQMQLTQDWMERLGKALGVHPTEVLSDPPMFRTVYVCGGIKDATTIHSYHIIADDDTTEFKSRDEIPFSVQFGAPEPDRTIWYVVDSEIFYPIIREGDLVRFTYPALREMHLFIGRLCLIDLNHAKPTRLLGVPTRGSSSDLFDIQVFGKHMINDTEIDDIAFMSMVISNPDMDTYENGEPKP
jgi:transcriptional regulator with XRE-family HTH domain